VVVVAQPVQIERFGLPHPLFGTGHPQPRIGQRHPGIGFHQQDAFFQVCRLHGVVGVQAADIKPFRHPHPGVAGGGSALVLLPDDCQIGAPVRPLKRVQHARRDIVGRAVIDHDDLEIPQGLCPDAGDGVTQKPAVIVAGDHHRH